MLDVIKLLYLLNMGIKIFILTVLYSYINFKIEFYMLKISVTLLALHIFNCRLL